MSASFTRRQILAAGGTLAAASLLRSPLTHAADPPAEAEGPRIKKAVKIGMVQLEGSLVDKFKLVKSLGYDGIELDSPNSYSQQEVLDARDEADLPIHGVVDSAHWKQTLSHPDPAVRAEGVEARKTAVQDAKAYGASSVLLVVTKVDENSSYSDAYKLSQAGIRQVLPMAKQLKIDILFENVWNNFLLSPLEFARYIDDFESPRVGAYFDVGNVVRFGWPEHWIQALGKRIRKLDIKEFSRELADTKGPGAGFGAEIGEGSVNWPAVMKGLDEIGYSGWATAEVAGGGEDRLREIKERMDRVLVF